MIMQITMTMMMVEITMMTAMDYGIMMLITIQDSMITMRMIMISFMLVVLMIMNDEHQDSSRC